MCRFSTSPIDIMPARRSESSLSSTGIWRNSPFVMRSITLLIELFTSQVETLRVITGEIELLRDGQLQSGTTSTFRHRAYDVALDAGRCRQNAGEAPVDAKDHQCADTMLGTARRIGECCAFC